MTSRAPLIGFNSNPLDRCSGRRNDDAFIEQLLAHPTTQFFVFDGDIPLLKQGDAHDPSFSAQDVARFGDVRQRIFLGVERNGAARFAIERVPVSEPRDVSHAGADVDTDLLKLDLRSIALQGLVEDELLGMLGEAKSMLDWHRRHSFCANCGTPDRIAAAGWQRICDACGTHHFPRVDPVVIMLVIDGERCLLGRQRPFAPGMYSALAGFIEPGETAEAAVQREVMEEAGIACSRVTYFASQPWPFPSSLMIGCFAHADSTAITVDHTELEDARWFSRDEVTSMLAAAHPDGLSAPKAYAIAHHLLRAYVERGADVLER
jgi:NAD+ diphosphatase